MTTIGNIKGGYVLGFSGKIMIGGGLELFAGVVSVVVLVVA